jgi:Tfp pilus assembly protein PilV
VVKCCKSAFSAGQSLIEVVVAVGMISILLVALLSLVSLSLKNSRMAQARTQAVSLAEEGIELMRAYRDYSWTTILSQAGNNYDLPVNWVVTDGLASLCPDQPTINDTYWRCVDLVLQGADELAVEISVSWIEGGQTFSTVQDTNLSLWER